MTHPLRSVISIGYMWFLVLAVFMDSTGVAGEKYRPWVEKRAEAYSGRYLHFADGPKGELDLTCTIEIKVSEKGVRAWYSDESASGTEDAKAELSGASISGDEFHARPIVIKAEWPGFMPRGFDGKFVHEVPKPNEKKKLQRGLLLDDGTFFVREKD
jgi:hypothetical protein